MLKNLIVLPDGREIFSGEGTVNAIQSVTLTQQVNNGTDLTLGTTCANRLEATVITPAGGLSVAPGTELTLYKVSEGGGREKVGLFTVQKTTRPSANHYKLTAYDRISWLDRELTDWLESLNGWPYSLLEFARMVCAECDLTLVNNSIPNGDWQIEKFFISGITGRQLMQWVGQACGRFYRATADGEIELVWYTPKDITIAPQGEHPILELQYGDYQVAPVDKVQIQLTGKDVGVIYGAGDNAYAITGNFLLASDSQEALQGVAQTLYEILCPVSYTPCRVTIPITMEIQAGDIIQVTDRNGQNITMYVMSKIQSGQKDTLECTGNARRDSNFMSNGEKFSAINGKVLEMQVGIQGLKIANRELGGEIISAETLISQNTENIQLRATKTEVQTAKEEAIETSRESFDAQLKVMSDSISMNFKKTQELEETVDGIKNEGASHVVTSTGYTFNEDGMTIKKSGQAMKTQITQDGMIVYKNGREVLSANSAGVNAVDLHASTYLIIGKGDGRSRFEDYGTDRIGCFWIG